MSTDLNITLTMTDGSPDELRALRAWLVQEEQLRGRVTLTPAGPPEPGTLGVALEVLSVSIESGGAVTVLIAGIMSWIRQRYSQRHRASTTVIKLRRADGAMVEISAATAGTWSAAEIAAQIRQLVQDLDPATRRLRTGSQASPAGSGALTAAGGWLRGLLFPLGLATSPCAAVVRPIHQELQRGEDGQPDIFRVLR
jgi:hypothetical protein